MKLKYIVLLTASLVLFSCKKNGATNAGTEIAATAENSNEESLTQDSKTLTNDKGETITVTYFAKGIDVALRLKKETGEEHELTAKGSSKSGNPIFTDESYMWEMSKDGQSGTLTDKDNNKSVYK